MAASQRDGRSSSASSHSGSTAPNRSSSIRTPKRQRSQTSATALDEKTADFSCPVCFNLIDEAYITKCGHTFCYSCILKSIETIKRCPKCNSSVTSSDMIFPNFLLNDLIKKHKSRLTNFEALGLNRDSSGEFADGLRDFVASESQNLTLPDVNVMLEVLTQRKQLLEAESCAAQNRLLLEFLKHLLKQKKERQTQIIREISIIEHDVEQVQTKLKEVHSKCPTLEDVERAIGSTLTSDNDVNVIAMKKEMIDMIDNIGSSTKDDCTSGSQQKNASATSLAMRRRRMHAHFDDFVDSYFTSRSKDIFFGTHNKDDKTRSGSSGTSGVGLDEFRENLIKFSRYNSLRVLATLNYSSDLYNNSTIVSSIEFDKDNEFLAIAGVTKKIKVFDYGAVIKDTVDIHYPCIEMLSKSKISCVSWNSYHKSILASSDYEGTVTIWDASTGQRTKTYQEHEKRASENKVKAGKSFLFWGLDQEYQSVAVVGLGKKEKSYDEIEGICQESEAVRIAACAGCKALDAAGIKNIFVESLDNAERAAEGANLSRWKFQEYKTKKDELPRVSLYQQKSDDCSSNEKWDRGIIKAEAQNNARLLADTPANLLTPSIFAQRATEILGSQPGLQIQVHDQKWAEGEKMGAFLAVAKGSVEPPKFLEISYGCGDKPPVVLIGKGVTFDAGGISLKPSASMDHMRADMAGGAAVIGTLYALTRLNCQTPVKALIPLVENMPSGAAVKPGDVIVARNGKTICVDNTDAEGRLILADALSYSEKFKGRWVLDIATLTGAMAVAVGGGATGVFTNSYKLFDSLERAGRLSGDRVWKFPLWKFYTKQISENPGYDLNNIGKSRYGGSCTAAAFLREFVPQKTDWMHLDIAGVMGPDDSTPYLGKGMTGRPTRTLVEFITSQDC